MSTPRSRPVRLAIALLAGLDHFVQDMVEALRANGSVEVKLFRIRGASDIAAALAWTDQPDTDSIWFEFCWPPFPALIAATDFGGRRVIVRIHRIEAYGTDHVARTDWSRVTDVIVVGQDMARRALSAAPEIELLCNLHVIHNGLDLRRFIPLDHFDPHCIGWCGTFSFHKNPMLALEVLYRMRQQDERYRMRISSKGGDPVAMDAFRHISARLRLTDAIDIDGAVDQADMPLWHRQNGVLLSTSVYESFGYAIAEAAACGCDLAILDNTAAGEFWPEASRFAAVEQAMAIIRAARPHRWRDLVATRFGIEMQAARIVEMLTAPRAGGVPNSHEARPFVSAGAAP